MVRSVAVKGTFRTDPPMSGGGDPVRVSEPVPGTQVLEGGRLI